MSKEYIEVLNELQFAPLSLSGLVSEEERGRTVILPTKIFQHIQSIVTNENLANKFKVYKEGFYVEITPDELQKETLRKCKAFLKECNYDDPFDYKIILARFEDKKIAGFADVENKRIILSEVVFARGVQDVTNAIIEEYIHIKYNVKDETRGFQDAAITELINILKKKNAFAI